MEKLPKKEGTRSSGRLSLKRINKKDEPSADGKHPFPTKSPYFFGNSERRLSHSSLNSPKKLCLISERKDNEDNSATGNTSEVPSGVIKQCSGGDIEEVPVLACNEPNFQRTDPVEPQDSTQSSNTCLPISENTKDEVISKTESLSKRKNVTDSTDPWPKKSLKLTAKDTVSATSSKTISEAAGSVEESLYTPVKDEGTKEDDRFRIPYYLEYFHIILDKVMGDQYYALLFDTEDMSVLETFRALSESGQKLFIRLFQRKLRWLRAGQIDYQKIAGDLSPVLEELVASKLLLDQSEMKDIADILMTLPAGNLRTLAKSLRLSTSEQRPTIIEAIQKHAKQKSIRAFFGGKDGGTNEASVIKRGHAMLGKCYHVHPVKRLVFLRVMMLFSLHNITGEEETRNTHLFQMLMNNIGEVTYPEYTINRRAKIFRDRDDFLTFCTAVQLEADIREAVEGNNIKEALEIYEKVTPMFDSVLKDKNQTKHAKSLPEHLRWYTPGAVYLRILIQGVEALQKNRDYQQAVKQLKALIKQNLYHTDYRGRVYDRLALNIHTHLKQPEKALELIKQGLADPCVRVGHRLSIWQRAQKICTAPATKKLHHHWDDFKGDAMSAVKDSPKITIKGKQIAVPGAASRWCTNETFNDGTGEVTFIKNVEEVALRHYGQNGYPQGLHGEGGTVSVFFSLLMWEALFDDIPDAFISTYQTAPLDIYTDNFYQARQKIVDQRLIWIRDATEEQLAEEFAQRWVEKHGTASIGIHWERFEDLQHAQGLLKCMGGRVVSAMFDRLAKYLRFTRSGFPDLIVWNTDTKRFKVVEVKGPGDSLSTKQILWLDFLLSLGVDAEVCYVTAVGAKRLRP